jgi:hypothetical protein
MLSYNENPQLVKEKVEQVYNLLKELSEIDDFPAICYNARRALGTVWQVANHLEIKFEQLFDHKV